MPLQNFENTNFIRICFFWRTISLCHESGNIIFIAAHFLLSQFRLLIYSSYIIVNGIIRKFVKRRI